MQVSPLSAFEFVCVLRLAVGVRIPRTRQQSQRCALVFVTGFKSLFLCFGCFCLIFLFPFIIGHAVNHFPCLWLLHCNSLVASRLLISVGQTVAAKSRQVHQINILNIISVSQMGNQSAKSGCFQFSFCFLIHDRSPELLNLRYTAISGSQRRKTEQSIYFCCTENSNVPDMKFIILFFLFG